MVFDAWLLDDLEGQFCKLDTSIIFMFCIVNNGMHIYQFSGLSSFHLIQLKSFSKGKNQSVHADYSH